MEANEENNDDDPIIASAEKRSRIRIILEALVVLLLLLAVLNRFGIIGNSDSDTDRASAETAKNPESVPSEVAENEEPSKVSKFFEKHATSKKPKKKTKVAATANANQDITTSSTSAPVEEAQAPAFGLLKVFIATDDGQAFDRPCILVDRSSGVKIPVRNGQLETPLNPGSYYLYASTPDGEFQSEAKEISISAGEGLEVTFVIPSPEPVIPIGFPGVILEKTEIEFAEVTAVIPGSSAAQIGLGIGDVVIEINGMLVKDLNPNEVLQSLQGELNTAVNLVLVVEDNGRLVDVPVNLTRSEPLPPPRP